MMLAVLSGAMKRYFVERGDTKTNRIKVAIPANIRWQAYDTYDQVALENKFAILPIKLHLSEDLHAALNLNKKITKQLKTAFPQVYAYYFLQKVGAYLTPPFIAKMFANKISKPFTLAFSNTPGVLRKITYKETETTGSISCMTAAGKIGLSIALLSYCEHI